MRRSKRRSGALGGGGGGGPAQRSAAIAGRWALCRVTFLWVPELPNRDPNSACVPCRLYMNRNVYKILGVIGAVGGKGSFDQRSGRELTVELQPLRLLLTAVNWVQDRYAACCEPLGKSCRRQRGFLRAGAHEPLLAHFEVLVKAACEGLYIGFGELRPSSCPRSERTQRRRERESASGVQCRSAGSSDRHGVSAVLRCHPREPARPRRHSCGPCSLPHRPPRAAATRSSLSLGRHLYCCHLHFCRHGL